MYEKNVPFLVIYCTAFVVIPAPKPWLQAYMISFIRWCIMLIKCCDCNISGIMQISAAKCNKKLTICLCFC